MVLGARAAPTNSASSSRIVLFFADRTVAIDAAVDRVLVDVACSVEMLVE